MSGDTNFPGNPCQSLCHAGPSLKVRLAQFKQRVSAEAQERLTQNQKNLATWRTLLKSEITAENLQREAVAQTAIDYFQTALRHGAVHAFNEWASERNPYLRNVREKQMQGHWLACTGCHATVQAWHMGLKEPQVGPAWLSPVERISKAAQPPSAPKVLGEITPAERQAILDFLNAHIGEQARDESGTQGRTPLTLPALETPSTAATCSRPPLTRDALRALSTAQRIAPLIAPLGEYGYRIIPRETMSLLASGTPEQLRNKIMSTIALRHQQYGELKMLIAAERVNYLDLAVVLEQLLPSVEPDIRAAVQMEQEQHRAAEFLGSLTVTVASLLACLFPPLILGVTAMLFAQGYKDFQTGATYMLGTGANDVFTREQQDAASDIQLSGFVNIVMATASMVGGARPTMDWSATRVAVISDMRIARQLVTRAAQSPIPAAEVEALMRPGLAGRMAHRYLDARSFQILYRGQGAPSEQILSPIARKQGLPASLKMEEALQAVHLDRTQIAGYTARWNDLPVPRFDAPPGMAGQPLGGAGIPATGNMAVASHFARSSAGGKPVIYVLRVPKGLATNAGRVGWGAPNPSQSLAESEWVIMHEINGQYVVKTLPAEVVEPLVADSPPGMGWSLTRPK